MADDIPQDLVIGDGEPGWSVAVIDRFAEQETAVFYGSESTVWITEGDGRLSVELFVSDTTDAEPLSACLGRRPLGECLWQFCDSFARGDTSSDDLAVKLKEPVPFEEKNEVSVLAAYRETLKRAMDLCDRLISEHGQP